MTTIAIVTILHNILFILHITSHIILIQLHIAFHIFFVFHAFYKHSKNFISAYVMPTYSKEVDTGKNCMYLRVLSLYETVISIYTCMTQTGPIIAAYVSLIGMPTYPSTQEHRQEIKLIKFLSQLEISDYSYLIYIDNYNHMYSYGILTDHYSFILVR